MDRCCDERKTYEFVNSDSVRERSASRQLRVLADSASFARHLPRSGVGPPARSSISSTADFSSAKCAGMSPASDLALASAPAPRSIATTPSCPPLAAVCRGVSPSPSRAFAADARAASGDDADDSDADAAASRSAAHTEPAARPRGGAAVAVEAARGRARGEQGADGFGVAVQRGEVEGGVSVRPARVHVHARGAEPRAWGRDRRRVRAGLRRLEQHRRRAVGARILPRPRGRVPRPPGVRTPGRAVVAKASASDACAVIVPGGEARADERGEVSRGRRRGWNGAGAPRRRYYFRLLLRRSPKSRGFSSRRPANEKRSP